MRHLLKLIRSGVIAAGALALPVPATADESYDALKAQVQTLTQDLKKVQEALKQYQQTAATKGEIEAVKKDAEMAKQEAIVAKNAANAARNEASTAKSEASVAAEWLNSNSLIHMAGYADIGYTDAENSNGTFNAGTFAPIFHFQYRDLVMLESELELEVEPDGETELGLEYLTVDLFLKDYLTLVGGKFLSPIGQFRQNLHPSWINKLPSAPVGFGHDGAAPISDLGIQARGGFALGKERGGADGLVTASKSFKPAAGTKEPKSADHRARYVNYAVYVGNGPELHSVTEDGTEFELEGIAAEAFGRDSDGNKVVGGRIGFLPIPKLEIGASFITGKAEVTALENETTGITTSLTNEQDRDYDVFGFDFAWQFKKFDTRGEYVESRVGPAVMGTTPSPSVTWKAWYAQAARQIGSSKFEGVVRYANFDSPHDSADQKQWVIGLNYLYTPTTIAKVAFESNDGQPGAVADADRWLVQLAYGF